MDDSGSILSARKFNRIKQGTIVSLNIGRRSESGYEWVVTSVDRCNHTRWKLTKWLAALIIRSPRPPVGARIGAPGPLVPHLPPVSRAHLTWTLTQSGSIQGSEEDGSIHARLNQETNAITWREEGVGRLWVFYPDPSISAVQKELLEGIQPKNMMVAVRRSYRKVYHTHLANCTKTILEKWTRRRERNKWNFYLQEGAGTQLWLHGNVLTDYQVWVHYRVVTMQVNTFYRDRKIHHRCPLSNACAEADNSIEHVLWSCDRAQQFWKIVLLVWTGSTSRITPTEHQRVIAGARAPDISGQLRKKTMEGCGEYYDDLITHLQSIWWGICIIGWAKLWQYRNQVLFTHQTSPTGEFVRKI